MIIIVEICGASTIQAKLKGKWKRRRNRGKSVRDCRKAFAKGEVGLTAIEGLSLFAKDREVLPRGHGWELSGSVDAECRYDAAYLHRYDDGRVRLSLSHDDGASPDYGSASRGE